MKRIDDFKRSYIRVRIESLYNERILNYLWSNSVEIKTVKNNSKYSMELQIKLKHYNLLRDIVKRNKGSIKILDRKGLDFINMKIAGRKAFIIGIIIFFSVIYYLSGFIWHITINTDKYLAPLEVRNLLKTYGIMVGSKKNIDVQDLEEKIIRDVDEVMWVKARIRGSELEINIVERQEPPQVIKGEENNGNIVASKDGIINRIYTKAGTPVKTSGDLVKAGDVIVKGQEGKEGMEFQVKAKGVVYATTFYEEIKEVPKEIIKSEKTGEIINNYYIRINNKKFYIKNSLNIFKTYDKIENKNKFLNEETYYETKQIKIITNPELILTELENKIRVNLDKSTTVLKVMPEIKDLGNSYRIRVLITAEENIAVDEGVGK